MKSDDLRAWQAHMAYTYDTAAVTLGISRATYARYISGAEIPLVVGLACSALALGLSAWENAATANTA